MTTNRGTLYKDISEYSDILSNFTLIDGLTPDMLKAKYIWILNAVVEDAILGEDDYGLVWYSGNWLAGEWEDGTWYSGIWYTGEWKNGRFYSYRFDKKQLLLRNKRILERDNPIYSEFRGGIWRRGSFYNGYFGPEVMMDGYKEIDWNQSDEPITYTDIIYWPNRWEGGEFYNGIFRNAAWMQTLSTASGAIKSNFHNGIFFNSEWINGTFLNGTFQGNRWWSGNFTGGDFVLGEWRTGIFNQSNSSIKSRFGSWPLSGFTNMTWPGIEAGFGSSTYEGESPITWRDGQFINGEFHSGLNIVSGITSISTNHNLSRWISGTWQNGIWYGGTWSGGTFNNGYWYEGYWVDGVFNNGYWYNGYWSNGVINGGNFIQGLFKNSVFNKGQLGYQETGWLEWKTNLEKVKISMLPKII